MMMSTMPTFIGFSSAQRALLTAQTALNTVNHNVSNANVEGYTKQRVDMATERPISNPSLGSSNGLFPIGQGVKVTGITQLRNSFLDRQVRKEVAIFGEVDTAHTALKQLEAIVGEPSFSGLADSIQAMFDSISAMRNNPQSLAARTSFIQQSRDMVNIFAQQGRQLLDMHKNLVGTSAPGSWENSQLGIRVTDVNEKLATIADLNRQIGVVVSAGAMPNDLLDKRNLLVEKVSKLIDVTVTEKPNQQIDMSIGGELVLKSGAVIDTLSLVASTATNADRIPARLTTTTGAVDITNVITAGEIKGVLDVAGNNATIKNVYSTFEDLSNLLETLSDEFNALQSTGRDLTGALNSTGAFSELYTTDAAWTSGPRLMFIKVNTAFDGNMNRIALANNDSTAPGNFAGVGDSRNAAAMVALKQQTFAGLNGNSFETFHQNVVSSLGTDSRSYDDRQESQENLLTQLEGSRQSVSGVNTDEEALDLIKYQRMFEASSRIVQTYSQIYASIINMLG